MADNLNYAGAAKIIEQQVDYLVPGAELARDVYSSDGKVLAGAGTIISQHTLNKLKNWMIAKVYIVEEAPINPIADPKLQQFLNNYNQSVTAVETAFTNIRETQEIPIDTFESTASNIQESMSATGNIVDQLYNFPPCDDYTFRHSVNVCAIAALIATWLKMPPQTVTAVSLTGLLHDVGKAQLPPHLLNQPYSLSAQDYEHYKQHTLLGYNLVSKIPHIAQSIMSGVIQHHEREDGSGYPHGLTSNKIHPYAKIVAVADLYDEYLTINCDQPGTFSPYVSLEKLRDQFTRIDAKSCIIFTDNMTNFLSGNLVSLSDGRQGRVVFINKEKPSRSMVQLEGGKVLDLNRGSGVHIKYVIR